jgi:hypothetical protein
MKFQISELHHLDDVDEAPERLGLYVWYARLSVGTADWDERETSCNAKAQAQLQKVLRDHTIKFKQQALQLDALANFSTRWSGGLEPASAESSNYEANDSQLGTTDKLIASSTASNQTREALLTLFDNAFPIFSSPLYIGLAIEQSIRSRLKQHRNKIRRHWDNASKDPEYISKIKPDSFADRAIKVGFSPRDLYFYTLHIESEAGKGSEFSCHDLLRSAEWILNRWATPILGRK